MAELDQLRARYQASLAGLHDSQSKAKLTTARDALLQKLLSLLMDRAAQVDLSRWMSETVEDLKKRIEADSGNTGLHFELGIFSTLVKVSEWNELEASSVEPSRDVLDVLRVLDVEGPLNKSSLSRHLFSAVKDSSGPSMVSRLTKHMRELNLTTETKRGRERLVEPTEKGRALLSRQIDSAWTAMAGPSRPMVNLRQIELREAAFPRPLEKELQPNDRSRFQLLVGGLCVAREMLEKPYWRETDYHFAQLLTRFPLGATPDDHDRESLNAVSDLWPERDRDHYRLMDVLFRFQAQKNRQGLVDEVMDLGYRLEEGSVYALLWSPCALNVAVRSGLDGSSRQTEFLFSRTEQVLKPLKNPLASFIRGMVAKLQNEPQRCRQLWSNISKEAKNDFRSSATEYDRRLQGLYPQLEFGGQIHPILESFEVEYRRFVFPIISGMKEGESFLKNRGGEPWAHDLAHWTVAHRLELRSRIEEQIEKEEPQKLFAAARKVATVTMNAPQVSEREFPDFSLLVSRHREHANWILGAATDCSPDHESASQEEIADWYEGAVLNNAWGPELVWADACLGTAVPTAVRGLGDTGTHRLAEENRSSMGLSS